MAQFKPYAEGIEVRGTIIRSTIDGMGVFKNVAFKILSDVGFDNIIFSEDRWYSQKKWLEAFRRISEEVGPNTLFTIGTKIMKNAVLPPLNTIEEALSLMDIAYHMNYRDRKGRILYDPVKKVMSEGIGHYKCIMAKDGKNKAIMFCDNPYPCDFDRGIITEFSRKFSPFAKAVHIDSKPCRKKGADSCTYLVTW